jgi:hypothetical protein
LSVRRGFLIACWLAVPVAGQAATIVHVKYPVYGCEKPDSVGAINNEADPRHTDPNWLATTMGYGQCVRITPQSPWEPMGADVGGLTLLAYRGDVGRPGSFYVPTAAIDFAAGGGSAPDAGGAGLEPQPGGTAPADQAAGGGTGTAGAPAGTGTGNQAGAAVPAAGAAAPAAGDPQLAEVEAGVAKIEPAESSSSWPLLSALALVAACGGFWLVWRRRRAMKRARLLDAIRLVIAGNAQALRAKQAQTVQTDEYGTAEWSQWNAAKDYYISTRIDPIVAEHGFRRLPAGL